MFSVFESETITVIYAKININVQTIKIITHSVELWVVSIPVSGCSLDRLNRPPSGLSLDLVYLVLDICGRDRWREQVVEKINVFLNGKVFFSI